jgi:hypothetical protein
MPARSCVAVKHLPNHLRLKCISQAKPHMKMLSDMKSLIRRVSSSICYRTIIQFLSLCRSPTTQPLPKLPHAHIVFQVDTLNASSEHEHCDHQCRAFAVYPQPFRFKSVNHTYTMNLICLPSVQACSSTNPSTSSALQRPCRPRWRDVYGGERHQHQCQLQLRRGDHQSFVLS